MRTAHFYRTFSLKFWCVPLLKSHYLVAANGRPIAPVLRSRPQDLRRGGLSLGPGPVGLK